MPGGQLTPNTRLFNNPYGYNGEDYDIESGLQFLRARYYNPETARFITRDSYLGDVMEPLSLNRYAYTANNPLKYTDPSGHKYVSEDEGNKQVEAYNNLYYKSLSQPAKNGPVLKVGSTNKGSIKELQNILINLGYDLGPSGADGYFGEKTKTAVIKFQKSNGLDTDGIVGAKTWKSLQREQTDNENIKSVMKIKEHDYVAEKTSQSKTVSKNDVGCGDLGDISNGIDDVGKTDDNYSKLIEKSMNGQYWQDYVDYVSQPFHPGIIYGKDPGEEYRYLIATKQIDPKQVKFDQFVNVMGPVWETEYNSKTLDDRATEFVGAIATAVTIVEGMYVFDAAVMSMLGKNPANSRGDLLNKFNGKREAPKVNTPSINTKVINAPEVKAPNAIKSSEVTSSWESYLGKNTTNINPRTGQVDSNRIFSADGNKSVRFDGHEMNSMGTTKFHYHMETWSYDAVNDTMTVTNTLQRIK